jgi:DNA (cytosine-5)-methyltransferase 1
MVEWDSHACRSISHNKSNGVRPMRDWPLVEADVRGIDYSPYADRIELVAGGPPCQPFSIAGKHRGALDARDMWPEAIRAVREIRPRAFLFENVRGLLRSSFADYLRYIVAHLSLPGLVRRDGETWADHLARLDRRMKKTAVDLRYRVEVHPVDAADYGAAQNRKRVIFVGIRDDLPTSFRFPRPTHSREALAWDQSSRGTYWDLHGVPRRERPKPIAPGTLIPPMERPWRTVRDAIGDLPEPRAREIAIPNHRYQPGAKSYVGHTGSPLDQPAKALKAGDHGVPGGENMLRRHDGSVRYFTVREAARLQGFPDDYEFPDNVVWSEAMRQLGNAVPSQLAEAVGFAVSSFLSDNTKRAIAA